MSDGRDTSSEDESGPDLDELRNRLDALQGSVERLGRDEHAGADPTAPPAGDPSAHYAAPPRAPYDHSAEAPPAYQPPDPGYASYAPPPMPAAPESYYDPPPPAATNGGTLEDLELATVTILDAGPFADLIELRHFEEAVTRLDTVRDVRVRRFGHQRAKVEIGMVADYAIGSELYRLGRPMQVELGPDGEVIVDFTDVPAAPEPELPEAIPGEPAEPAGSEDEDSGAEEKA